MFEVYNGLGLGFLSLESKFDVLLDVLSKK